MKRSVVLAIFLVLLVSGFAWSETRGYHLIAHRSGCHRRHSCPSDRGTYTCGDLGHCSRCPDNRFCKGGRPRPIQERSVPSASPLFGVIVGLAVVTDGDTLRIGTARIRLFGFDAPESRQSCRLRGRRYPCGKEATKALRDIVKGKTVTCQPTGDKTYGRLVAVCSVDGLDIGDWMVRHGWALAYRRFSRKYVPAEEEAQRERRGIWRGRFMKPWEWRRAKRLR